MRTQHHLSGPACVLLMAAIPMSIGTLATMPGCSLFRTNFMSDGVDSRALQYIDEGRTLQAAGDLDAALAQFEKALELDPDHIDAHIGVGDIHRVKGDYNKAAESFAKARRIQPGSYDANYKLGLMYHLLNRLTEAVQTYLSALTIDPDSFEANLNIATAYLQLNQPSLALPYGEKAVRLNSESQPAHVNLGAIYSALGRHEDAVLAYRDAADRGELSPPVAVNLVNALIRTRGYERAVNTLDTLLRMEQRADYHERLGYCHFKLGDFARSRAAYARAVEMDAQNTAALNGLGVTLMTGYIQDERRDLSMRDQALDCWRRSVRLNRDQPQIVDLISRFAAM